MKGTLQKSISLIFAVINISKLDFCLYFVSALKRFLRRGTSPSKGIFSIFCLSILTSQRAFCTFQSLFWGFCLSHRWFERGREGLERDYWRLSGPIHWSGRPEKVLHLTRSDLSSFSLGRDQKESHLSGRAKSHRPKKPFSFSVSVLP